MKLSAIGITPQKEKQFNGKGIFSVEDMVRYLPRKYNDFSRETGILPEDQISCLIVTVNKVCTYNNGKPLMIVFCETEDGKRIFVKWFHQNYLAAKYEEFVGHKVYLCAKLEYSAEYDNYSATSPEMFEPRISIGKRIILSGEAWSIPSPCPPASEWRTLSFLYRKGKRPSVQAVSYAAALP